MSVDIDIDFEQLDRILETGTRADLDQFCANNNLSVKDGRIVYNEDVNDKIKFWDKRQLIRKILLNS